MNQEKIETITINDVEYVKKDSVVKAEAETDSEGRPYVIVRSKDQGVMCGYRVSVTGRTVVLKQARQIYRYSSKFVLPDVAEFGLTKKFESKLSCAMTYNMEMLEACGVLHCTQAGAKSLIEYKAVDNG